jgi:hypothetical protein
LLQAKSLAESRDKMEIIVPLYPQMLFVFPH